MGRNLVRQRRILFFLDFLIFFFNFFFLFVDQSMQVLSCYLEGFIKEIYREQAGMRKAKREDLFTMSAEEYKLIARLWWV